MKWLICSSEHDDPSVLLHGPALQEESLTPYGFKLALDGDESLSSKRKRLRAAIAGSTCVDHSAIGYLTFDMCI